MIKALGFHFILFYFTFLHFLRDQTIQSGERKLMSPGKSIDLPPLMDNIKSLGSH